VDVDGTVNPDYLASIADLREIPDSSIDAIWCSHCVEHLFAYEVPLAFAEFRRVLTDTGFACIIVPDLQAIAHWIAEDRLHDMIYRSAAGPITAHDMIWGFGPAIARGKPEMAHRCGFTPTLFLESLKVAGFSEIVLRRRAHLLELAGLALQKQSESAEQRARLMRELGL
jgi:hypothetical protein